MKHGQRKMKAKFVAQEYKWFEHLKDLLTGCDAISWASDRFHRAEAGIGDVRSRRCGRVFSGSRTRGGDRGVGARQLEAAGNSWQEHEDDVAIAMTPARETVSWLMLGETLGGDLAYRLGLRCVAAPSCARKRFINNLSREIEFKGADVCGTTV